MSNRYPGPGGGLWPAERGDQRRIPLDAPLAPRTRRYDPYRRCACGHIASHHRQDTGEGGMTACRMASCECEGFTPRRREVQVNPGRGEGSGT